jgi:phosphatidate cytidylyltransferase
MTVPHPEKRKRDVRVRLIASPLILALLFGVLWLHQATGSAVGTHLVLLLFGAAAGAEMALLLRASGRAARPLQAAIGCALLCGVGLLPIGLGSLVPRVALLLLVFLGILLLHLRDTRPDAVEAIGVALLPILYVGFLLTWMGLFAQAQDGGWLVLWVVLTAKASDMAGWLVGVPFGRHKMIPSVSPGKSWEGTVAGLAASVLVGIFLPGPLGLAAGAWSVGWRAAFGFLVGAASILAGVTWSGWKRRLGAKDSSALLPEMGGVLDMVDSLLLAGPAAALVFFLLAPTPLAS